MARAVSLALATRVQPRAPATEADIPPKPPRCQRREPRRKAAAVVKADNTADDELRRELLEPPAADSPSDSYRNS
jgi:hypothetical protein